MKTSRKRRQKGQALVEAALVLLVAMATVIGALDFGQVMFIRQSLVDRVRAGARYAALHSDDLDAARNTVVYGSTTAPSSEGDGASPPAGFLGLTPSMVSVTRVDPNTPNDRVVVAIAGYPLRFSSPFIAGLYKSKPITASAPSQI